MPKAAATSLQQDRARPSGTGRTGAARGSSARTGSRSGQRERSGALSWLQVSSYSYGTLGASQQVPFTFNNTGGRASGTITIGLSGLDVRKSMFGMGLLSQPIQDPSHHAADAW